MCLKITRNTKISESTSRAVELCEVLVKKRAGKQTGKTHHPTPGYTHYTEGREATYNIDEFWACK